MGESEGEREGEINSPRKGEKEGGWMEEKERGRDDVCVQRMCVCVCVCV